MAASQAQTTRFMQAALNGNLNLLKQLANELDNGDGLSNTFTRVKDEEGRTALHLAASGGQKHVCDYLIKTVELDVNLRDDNGDTPLHLAVLFQRHPMIIYLIENGANVLLSAFKGYTPLHYAAETGNTQILGLLISKGAEIDSVSVSGTPLQWAAAKGKREAVKFLLERNANPNRVAYNLYTPLLTTIIAEYVECSELLLKAGANPNLHACGLTPLAYAASRGMTIIVESLLKAGADPNAMDTSGLTPLECAALRGDHESVRILFPLTSQIQYFPEWSISGIMNHINSVEARAQINIKRSEALQTSKSKGAAAFRAKDYINAIFWYAEAKSADPDDATLYSNISLCWANLNEGDLALSEALACAKLRPNWSKAHYRIGAAWKILKNYFKAGEGFVMALELDPDNKEIKRAFKEALRLQLDAMD